MDEDRMRWITKQPKTLDRVEITLNYSETPSGLIAVVWAGGWCGRKRGYLWTHTETVAAGGGRYSASDLVHHLALVSEQDRPTSNADLTRGLCGSAWEQPELPF